MKTSFEFVDLIWSRLNADAALKASINGGIYKFKRPDGSTKQDIVINSLAVGNNQLQQGVINVNFHTPNLQVTIAGQPNISAPDNVKLKAVSDLIIPLLDDYWATNWHCHVQQHLSFEDEVTKEFFSNIRVNVFSINI